MIYKFQGEDVQEFYFEYYVEIEKTALCLSIFPSLITRQLLHYDKS